MHGAVATSFKQIPAAEVLFAVHTTGWAAAGMAWIAARQRLLSPIGAPVTACPPISESSRNVLKPYVCLL